LRGRELKRTGAANASVSAEKTFLVDTAKLCRHCFLCHCLSVCHICVAGS